ncbi:MAG: lipoate--protein ligase family protein [Anaerolineae bacterium]|nr:lipoate--protein ligase family protein [Anaerolineae bacterium]
MNHQKTPANAPEVSDNYPPATWRLLVTAPLDGATNMAVDEAILYALAEGQGLPTLRFFQWEPPCLSLGYNQHWRDVNEATCQRLGYTWTRRPTGGKAILHTDEVTYSLIIPQADPRIQGGIIESYRVLSLGLLCGLEKLGIQAEQAARDEVRAQRKAIRAGGGPVCFDTPSHYEITWGGKKLIGSAQLRRKQIVLQHGTLPLHGNLNRILNALALSDEEYAQQSRLLPQRATTLERVLDKTLSFEEVVAALAEGFAEQLNLTLAEMPLTDREQALANRLRAEQYANDAWNKRI